MEWFLLYRCILLQRCGCVGLMVTSRVETYYVVIVKTAAISDIPLMLTTVVNKQQYREPPVAAICQFPLFYPKYNLPSPTSHWPPPLPRNITNPFLPL